jgi:glutaredoxin
MIRIILYGRPGCHLCENVKEAVLSVQQKYRFEFAEFNIMDDDDLFNKYVVDIPVVTINGEYFCQYNINLDKFEEKLVSLTKENKI